MKRSQILQNLNGCLNQISQLQTQGVIQLTNRVAFGLAKNLNKCKLLQSEFNQYQRDKIKEFVNCDIKGNPKMIEVKAPEGAPQGTKPTQKWDFKETDSEQKMQESFNDYLEEDVLFIPHAISRAEIEIIHNIPVAFISTLDEFGIVSDSKLTMVN